MMVCVANATGWSREALLDLPASELIELSRVVVEKRLVRVPMQL